MAKQPQLKPLNIVLDLPTEPPPEGYHYRISVILGKDQQVYAPWIRLVRNRKGHSGNFEMKVRGKAKSP